MRHLGEEPRPSVPINGSGRNKSMADLERDADALGRDMAETLRQLERKLSPHDLMSRLSPRELVSRLSEGTSGARSGASEMLDNLGAALRDHPIPALLLASGVVSLIASERTKRTPPSMRQPIEDAGLDRPSSRGLSDIEGGGGEPSFLRELSSHAHDEQGELRERYRQTKSEVRARAEDLRNKTKSFSHDKTESLREKGAELRDRVGTLREEADQRVDALREQAGQLAEHTREQSRVMRERVREQAHAMRGQLSHQGQNILEQEPLVVLGLGLTIGAILSASMPDVPTLPARRKASPPAPPPQEPPEEPTETPSQSEQSDTTAFASADPNPFEEDREIDRAEEIWSTEETEETDLERSS